MNALTPKPEEMLFFGIKPEEKPAFPTHQVYAGANRLLTPPECDQIVAIAEAKGLGYGQVGNGTNDGFHDNPEYRSVSTCSLFPNDMSERGQDLKWLYAKILQRVHWANANYRFTLCGLNESIHFLKYETSNKDGRPPGRYNLHQDFGGGYSSLRKLSVVIQLSDPSEYEGCRLNLVHHETQEIREAGQGDMIIFPSWTPHFVTDITRGTRHALALWVSGPQFC